MKINQRQKEKQNKTEPTIKNKQKELDSQTKGNFYCWVPIGRILLNYVDPYNDFCSLTKRLDLVIIIFFSHNTTQNVCSLLECCNTISWILTLEAWSILGFFLSLEDDLFFFFFLEECSLDFIFSGFSEVLLAKLGDSCLAATFSWLVPTLRTSLIGFSPLSAFSNLSDFSENAKTWYWDFLALCSACLVSGRMFVINNKIRDFVQNMAYPHRHHCLSCDAFYSCASFPWFCGIKKLVKFPPTGQNDVQNSIRSLTKNTLQPPCWK